jgi:thiamine-monophosphate kinase
MISITIAGECLNPARGPVLRSGARDGDSLLVSGTLGDSAAGLHLLLRPELAVGAGVRAELINRHLAPTPRSREMACLLETEAGAVHAALDLSDGLAGDARHMARRSELSIEIDAERLPISTAARTAAKTAGADVVQWALAGGEDYELVLAVEPLAVPRLTEAVYGATGTLLTAIGRCVAGPAGVRILEHGVERPAQGGFTHF